MFLIAREVLQWVATPRGCELLLLRAGLAQLLTAAVKYKKQPPVVAMLVTCMTRAVEYLAEYFENILLSCSSDSTTPSKRRSEEQPSTPGETSRSLQLLSASDGNWWEIVPPAQAAHILNVTRGLVQDCD